MSKPSTKMYPFGTHPLLVGVRIVNLAMIVISATMTIAGIILIT